jgi:lipid-binding SYLF domain-containing protein
MKLSSLFVLPMAMLMLFSLDAVVFAQSSKDLKEAKKRTDSASEVVREIMADADKSIPKDLMEKAKAIVVFPGVLKAAFIIGGRGGEGVAVRRTADGWSAPAFLNIGGGSVGFQIGGEKIDYVLLIMNDGGLQGLLEDKFEIGGEASIAAGPVGRTAAASTNITLDAQILTYSRSQGAFAGVSLKGAVIKPSDLNQGIYKKTAKDVLITDSTPWTAAPKDLQKFPQTVATYAGK